jgi:hypothetical protein
MAGTGVEGGGWEGNQEVGAGTGRSTPVSCALCVVVGWPGRRP